jgi:hypothetical protein
MDQLGVRASNDATSSVPMLASSPGVLGCKVGYGQRPSLPRLGNSRLRGEPVPDRRRRVARQGFTTPGHRARTGGGTAGPPPPVGVRARVLDRRHAVIIDKALQGVRHAGSAGERVAVATAAVGADPLAARAQGALIADHVPAHPAVMPPPHNAELFPAHLNDSACVKRTDRDH